MWISIYHICLGKEARRKYKWDQHSKANVMRARKYMSEVLLDQIPNLSDLQRFLDQLAISAPPESGVPNVPFLLRLRCACSRLRVTSCAPLQPPLLCWYPMFLSFARTS